MAEPVAAAASIAGLASLAIQLSQLSYQHFSSLRGSSKAWSLYIQELSTLTSVLLKLQKVCDNAAAKDLAHILSAPALSSNSIKKCHKELDGLKSSLLEKQQKQGLRRKLEMLSWPFSESDTQEKVSLLHRFSTLFEASLIADNLTVSIESYRQLNNIKDVEEFEKLLHWFKPQYESLPLSYEVILESICPGTRSTILNTDTYVNWRDSLGATAQQPLWIYGPPGSGKTVMSAAMVNDITNCPGTLIAYHFFGHNQETLQDALQHVCHQLLSRPTAVSQVATDIYNRKTNRNASLVFKDLVSVICDIAATSSRVFVVLDGLDEFPYLNKLLKLLPKFVAAKAKVVVASRELPSVSKYMTSATLIDAHAERQDIWLYAHWRLEEDSKADEVFLTDDLKIDIASKLVDQANGSFLLARLIMDSICNATTIETIRKRVQAMPTKHEEAYENTYERILKQDQERQKLALSALYWICHSKRSLDMMELRHAISSLDEDPDYSPEGLVSDGSILSVCLGLVFYSKSNKTVDLIHLSARDFLTELFISQPTNANIVMARACLRYMAVPTMATGPCQSLDEFKGRITELPFLEYAARYYGYHVRPVQEDVLAELLSFLGNDHFRESSWQILHFVVLVESQSALNILSRIASQPTLLHVACYWGFSTLLQRSLATSSTLTMIDRVDSHGWSPLHWASSNGHSQSVQILLEAGAAADASDKEDWTPLFSAVVRGHGPIVRLLLDQGSDPLRTDENGFTPIHWAILAGVGDVAAWLLNIVWEQRCEASRPVSPPVKLTVEEAKSLVNLKRLENIFQVAVELSETEVFKTLASSQNRWDLVEDDTKSTLEYLSTLWNRPKIVLSKSDYMFSTGQLSNALTDAVVKQLLHNAIFREDAQLVKAIFNLNHDLKRDFASDVVSENGAGFVHMAASSGSAEIMRIITQFGVSLTATDSNGLTPLHYACICGSREIVDTILAANVEVDAKDKSHRTPLMLLLHYGAWRTLHAPGDTLAILGALTAKAASIHGKDSSGLQPIHYSMATMDPIIFQMLVDLGAKPGALSKGLETPLHILAGDPFPNYQFRDQEILRAKLFRGGVPSSRVEAFTKLVLSLSPPEVLRAETSANMTAIALAINRDQWIQAQSLLGADALFRCKSSLFHPLRIVLSNGFYELAQVLVKAGGEPEKRCLCDISGDLPAWKSSLRGWKLADTSGPGAFPRRDYTLTLKELLGVGVDVNYWCPDSEMNAIQIAVERGIDDSAYVAALLQGGADPYTKTSKGFDSFHLALLCGKLDNLTMLVQHAVHDTSPDHWLTNWLRASTAIPQSNEEIISICINALRESQQYAIPDSNHQTLLFHAISEGNQDLAEQLVMLGSDVKYADTSGWTSFHVAVSTRNMELVKLLMLNGADVLATTKDISPLFRSTSWCQWLQEEEDGLEEQEDGLQEQEDLAINALHIAVGVKQHVAYEPGPIRLSPDIVRLLLEHGIDPNAKAVGVARLHDSDHDPTPLQIMFGHYHTQRTPEWFAVVQLLVDFGADVRGAFSSLLPIEIAQFEGHERTWEAFRNVEPMSTD
ncbi:ankyrin [Polyplosphaeria fusca]|uniref:Ankyrin n=1 Tax=Polyplosphaeria fusca TaxID=682080 RepID=A0A9P4QLM4_9PLEO|nr:ankyrin [Polyplosphaeria fusca]